MPSIANGNAAGAAWWNSGGRLEVEAGQVGNSVHPMIPRKNAIDSIGENDRSSTDKTAAALRQAENASPEEQFWRRCVTLLATIGTIGVVIVALGSFVGKSWWFFDLASHFQLQYGSALVVFGVLLLALRRWFLSLVAFALLGAEMWLIVPLYARPSDAAGNGPVLKVMSLNVWAGNRDYQRVVDFIRQENPDVAVLVEVDERWREPLEALKPEWPYAEMTLGGGHLGVALLSRLPLDRAGVEFLSDGVPVVAARTSVDGSPVTLFGVHLDRPISPAGRKQQTQQLEELAKRLDRESTAIVILGDFNATSWSLPFAEFVPRAGVRDSRMGFGIQPSWPSFLPEICRIPIDHCLVSPDVSVLQRRLGPNVGSDHLPVIAELRLPNGANDEIAGESFQAPQ